MAIDIKNYKKILYIDLDSLNFVFKNDESLWLYIGGMPVSYKLMHDNFDSKPIVVSTGPLAGYYPYISKLNLLYLYERQFIEKYAGGSFAGLMNFVGLDSIVLTGVNKKDVLISINEDTVSIIELESDEFISEDYDLFLSSSDASIDNYFSFGKIEDTPMNLRRRIGIKIDSTKEIDICDYYDYENLYQKLLDSYKDLTVEPGNNPSCMGCPIGCEFSKKGEDDLNVSVLLRSMICCGYAANLYKDMPTLYGCLHALGYNYHHKHLEDLPDLFRMLKQDLSRKLI